VLSRNGNKEVMLVLQLIICTLMTYYINVFLVNQVIKIMQQRYLYVFASNLDHIYAYSSKYSLHCFLNMFSHFIFLFSFCFKNL
jgi:hypothetical protein